MKIMENDKGLYLFVDIDDFLVKSSPLIQRQVDEKAGFRTETLSMLEQTKRNCTYFYKLVAAECQSAFIEKRIPRLEYFLLRRIGFTYLDTLKFEELSGSDINLLYKKPIECAKEYVNIADLFLNRFLEERDTFLEVDNLPFGQNKEFNKVKEDEMTAYFTDLWNSYKNELEKINEFCFLAIDRIVHDAKRRNSGGVYVIPDYGDLIRMDSNDVLKTNSIDSSSSKEKILYEKPIETIRNCYYNSHLFSDIKTNSVVFNTPSRELIDYDAIYQSCNVNWGAVYLVQDLIASGRFIGYYALTHHNGNRELHAKKRLISEILPQVQLLDLRFHSNEHDVERRYRSSKREYVESLGFDITRAVLFDDSRDNCFDWSIKKEDNSSDNRGLALLYKPQTDSEYINGVLERSPLERITNFNLSVVLDIVDEKITLLNAKRKSLGGKNNGI